MNYYRITVYDPKLDYCAIIDAYGKFEKLWQFSAYLISKGYKVLEVGGKDKFLDGNIEPLPKPDEKILYIRATNKGKPITTTFNGKPAVQVKDRIYVPGTANN